MKHNLRITLYLVVLFFLAQLTGLSLLQLSVDVEKTSAIGEVVFDELPYSLERPDLAPVGSSFFIIAAILIGTALALLLIKFKQVQLWRLWYGLAVLLSLSLAFSVIISATSAFLLALILTLIRLLKPNVFVHNFTELFLYAGIALIFVPMLTVSTGFWLLVLISLYDMYAVWHSKHMITLAQHQIGEKFFAGLSIPYSKQGTVLQSAKKGRKSARVAMLGGGDIAFPLLFAGTVLVEYGLFYSMIISVFATMALFLLFVKAKKQQFYPAMPFISAGCFVGYLLLLLV